MTMQGPEGKALEGSVDSLITRSKDVQKSLQDFLHKIEQEHATLTWPSVLDNFALLSGQISSLLTAMKSDKTPPLRNYPVVPLKLSQDEDPHLLRLTDGRVSVMSHAEVPDYLRTKPDPEVELAEKQLIAEVGTQADQISMNQVNQFNKQCNKILEKIKNARANWRADVIQSSSTPVTHNPMATNELIATVNYGRGIKANSNQSLGTTSVVL
uniref:Mediator of RNA polymerase II transcription subunit 8 n=1 Tax=Phallusia mammillata TaxID=59560 RepID=A0A6F9DJW9_9ASCI|nr:mediator of RNA polymerase II transcription subunit 8 [Phallusia mammillata]